MSINHTNGNLDFTNLVLKQKFNSDFCCLTDACRCFSFSNFPAGFDRTSQDDATRHFGTRHGTNFNCWGKTAVNIPMSSGTGNRKLQHRSRSSSSGLCDLLRFRASEGAFRNDEDNGMPLSTSKTNLKVLEVEHLQYCSYHWLVTWS